ncbi:MAG: tripartite tricarboxylate transporter substrate binding protein [Proteobacteria bacterium]|nr:tripartite tricarboxylate transporter substrate binding protein [Pseudomonadota bacterium]
MSKWPALACMVLALLWPPAVMAEADAAFPARALRFVVPIAPGSSGDTLTRSFAEALRAQSGRATVVENRPGADLVIGTQHVVASPADGYSLLLVSNSSLVINPVFLKDLPYKADDLLPLIELTRSPAVLVTGNGSRLQSFGDLLDAARRAPGKVSVGVYGNSYRLGLLDLARRAGVSFNVIPYKGAGQAVSDAAGGNVDVVLLDLGGALPLVQGGKVRALAIAAEQRHAALPALPTVKESGVPDYTLYVFIGLAVHAKTPPAVLERLDALLQQTMARPGLREQMQRQSGAEISGQGRQAFAATIAAENARVREVLRTAGPDALADKP